MPLHSLNSIKSSFTSGYFIQVMLLLLNAPMPINPNHMPGLQYASCSMNIKLAVHFLPHRKFCIKWERENRTRTKESGKTIKASNIGSSYKYVDILIFILFCRHDQKKKGVGGCCWHLNENNSFASVEKPSSEA